MAVHIRYIFAPSQLFTIYTYIHVIYITIYTSKITYYFVQKYIYTYVYVSECLCVWVCERTYACICRQSSVNRMLARFNLPYSLLPLLLLLFTLAVLCLDFCATPCRVVPRLTVEWLNLASAGNELSAARQSTDNNKSANLEISIEVCRFFYCLNRTCRNC